jgi:signal transduction histidine kinase
MTKNCSLTQKWTLLVLLVIGITFLHYSTDQGQYYFHVFYGELYFLPIILAAFWFGLYGALLVSTTISICYLPFIVQHWQNLSPNDLDNMLSLLLYNVLAVLAGVMRGRETAAQEKLLQAENLAVMGRSLAAAAHDMKTPLMLIGGFARRILKKSGDEDPARTNLALIIKETEKMETMTRDMLDFSKPLTLNRIRGNFDTTVQDSLTKLEEATRRHNVAIEYRSHPDAVDISGDTLRLEQVIVNLVLNAIEASPEGGTVVVTLSPSPEGCLVLDVADNGCGIPFAKKQEVFNPFFTTKKEGTGLGLPIVKKIVEAHGWSLQILDNDCGGTIFRIKLGG